MVCWRAGFGSGACYRGEQREFGLEGGFGRGRVIEGDGEDRGYDGRKHDGQPRQKVFAGEGGRSRERGVTAGLVLAVKAAPGCGVDGRRSTAGTADEAVDLGGGGVGRRPEYSYTRLPARGSQLPARFPSGQLLAVAFGNLLFEFFVDLGALEKLPGDLVNVAVADGDAEWGVLRQRILQRQVLLG